MAASLGEAGLLRQTCGRVVVAGTVLNPTNNEPAYGLTRFDADGTVDATFGFDGSVITPIGESAFGFAAATQSDGKLLVGGATVNAGAWSMALARYDSDGALDPTFGGNGIVVTALPDGAFIHGIAIQADGRIVVSGGTLATNRLWLLARYLPSGGLDQTFGTNGIALSSHAADGGYGLAIQSDGFIVATNGTGIGRFDQSGAADSSFGVGGWVAYAFGSPAEPPQVIAVTLMGDGRILVGGGLNGADGVRRLTIAGYGATGTLDPSFGSGGLISMSLGGRSDSVADAMALDSLGRILAVGAAGNDILVARFGTSGALDTSFGGSGFVFLPFGTAVYPAALSQQLDGRIVVAASSSALVPAQPINLARLIP